MKSLPLIFVAVIGTVILIVQWNRREDLEKQMRSTQAAEVHLSSRRRVAASSPSELLSQREDLVTDLEFYVASRKGETMRLWSDELLDLLSQATAQDLHAVIKWIQENHPVDPSPRGRTNPYSSLLWSLKQIRNELDPIAVLQSENNPEAFMVLARKSPEEALKWLASSSLSPVKREGFMGLFSKMMISQEPSKHLASWKEAEDDSVSNGFVVLNPTGVEDLLKVVNHPENAEIQQSLVASIIFSSLMEGEGLARPRVESLGLDADKIVAAMTYGEILGSEEMLEWAIELGEETPEMTLDCQGASMAQFAIRDLKKAGEWLRDFEGPPMVQDEVTERYALILSRTEPETALSWIEQIQDEKRRNWMKQNTILTWEKNDPEGFAEWNAR